MEALSGKHTTSGNRCLLNYPMPHRSPSLHELYVGVTVVCAVNK